MKTLLKEALVLVDPQNDFCDPRGSLYVDGATADIERLSTYIKKAGSGISGIFVSLDTHDRVAIFHPSFWTNGAGERPAPYAPLTAEDFQAGRWRPVSPENNPFVEQTFAVMESRGIGPLTIWPEHCIVSSWGHGIAAPLAEALTDWSATTGLPVRYVFKGENPYTDQFSMFEGLDDSYTETAFNQSLFDRISRFDRVTFAGEALSHCVWESILSCARRWGRQTQEKARLLTDCTSPVAGFDREATLLLLRQAGVALITTLSA